MRQLSFDSLNLQYPLLSEIWKAVPNYEGIYEASNLGRVRVIVSRKSIKAGHILSGYARSDGYRYIRLSKNSCKEVVPIHRVILKTFDDRPDSDEYDVRHKNLQRGDNRVENLEWVTHSQATSQSIRPRNNRVRIKAPNKIVPFNLHPLTAEDLAEEGWLPVPQYEGIYEVSDMGRVRSVIERRKTQVGDLIGGSQYAIGYRYIHLTDLEGVRTRFLIHRLVLSAFNPIAGCEQLDVNHLNADKADNRLTNLEWASRSENILHAIHVTKTKKILRGSESASSFLTEDDVKAIRKLFAEGVTQGKLAQRYGVSQIAIHCIVRRKSWKHVS